MGTPSKITTRQLETIFLNEDLYRRGTIFLGFDYRAIVKLKGGKGNELQGRVSKIQEGFVGMIFGNREHNAYESMVNRRLEQMGKPADFKVGKLPWGTKVENTAVIEHGPTRYLQLIYAQSKVTLLDHMENNLGIDTSIYSPGMVESLEKQIAGYESRAGHVRYELDGKPIDPRDITGLEDRAEPEVASTGSSGLSTKFQVVIRTLKLEGFIRVALNGMNYFVEKST